MAELVADVDAIKKAMADQQDDFEKAAQRAKQQQEEEGSLLKARLATVTGMNLALDVGALGLALLFGRLLYVA